MFQSPSLRGSGRFRAQSRAQKEIEELVSIPFIAGQWSLLETAADEAVRAQLVSIPFIAGQWSLRALPSLAPERAKRVSIPFIAGQWSLPPRR